jgi:hypothetical protein
MSTFLNCLESDKKINTGNVTEGILGVGIFTKFIKLARHISNGKDISEFKLTEKDIINNIKLLVTSKSSKQIEYEKSLYYKRTIKINKDSYTIEVKLSKNDFYHLTELSSLNKLKSNIKKVIDFCNSKYIDDVNK